MGLDLKTGAGPEEILSRLGEKGGRSSPNNPESSPAAAPQRPTLVSHSADPPLQQGLSASGNPAGASHRTSICSWPPPRGRVALLYHLISSCQQRGWDGEAEGLGSLLVDKQLELGGLLNREIRGPGTSQNPVDVSSPAVRDICETGRVRE